MSGAVTAITTMRRPTTPPAIASGLRRANPRNSRAMERWGRSVPCATSTVPIWLIGSPRAAGPLLVTDARVEPRVAEVDRDVDEHEDHRVEQDQVLHDDRVP